MEDWVESVDTHVLTLPSLCTSESKAPKGPDLGLLAPTFIASVVELPVMRVVSEILSPGGLFVDAGAHIGFYTVALSRCFDQVVAYEPSRFQFAFLERNIHRNGLIHCYAKPTALGAKVSVATINVTGRTGGSNTLLDLREDEQPMDQYPVKVIPLDAEDYSDLTFMKIDVEGWELEVLKGASDTLRRCRPLILLEVWEDAEARRSVARFLGAHDYSFDFPFHEFPELAIGRPV